MSGSVPGLVDKVLVVTNTKTSLSLLAWWFCLNSPPFACLFTGNPALANEATAIAISVLTQNVDCFKQWDVLYKENLEASVALLNKLVDEWKDHSLKLSSSSSDTLTVKHAMNSFRMKNEKAITEGVANPSLYKEADQSCKLISRRLSRGIGIAPLTAMVIAAAGGAVVAGAAHALIYLARSKKSS
ncbi:BnaA06g16440D [Brassica napus]|uniref:BnaA06g16440D protein n=1 Tax=Brassica napus TaxID=3708 RepID=A0A078F4T7_BRANA|nr:BnaA06g16440D [Brassica napus]